MSGKTRVGTFRKTYGPGFAKGFRADMNLHTQLKRSRSKSRHEYLKKHHK
jgi:hypothetical protein